STKVYKGRDYCVSPRLDAKRLDDQVIDVLRTRFTPERIREIIEKANERIRKEAEDKAKNRRPRAPRPHERLREIEQQLQRIQRSIMAGFDPELWVDQVRELKEERDRIRRQLEEGGQIGEEAPALELIPDDNIDKLIDRIVTKLRSPETAERRQVVLSLVRQITLAPRQ